MCPSDEKTQGFFFSFKKKNFVRETEQTWFHHCALLTVWFIQFNMFKFNPVFVTLCLDIPARGKRPFHHPQDRPGGGAVRLPVHAETLRWQTDCCQVPCWQSH